MGHREVYQVEVYARVRRAVQVDGMSIRAAARQFGLARKTIRKMLQFSLPPGYERKKPAAKPKLGPWLGVIDQILVDDQTQPKKQRHTAKRIWDRLKAEQAFGGGYTVVKDYVRIARARSREVFVPLVHPPGHASRSRTPVLADRVTFCGERVGDSSTVEQRTLTPLILVRIQVNQPIISNS